MKSHFLKTYFQIFCLGILQHLAKTIPISYQSLLPLSRAKSDFERGVSFELQSGESLELFAPVGTGKSTLVDLIQKFYTPESGEIRLPFQNKENTSLTEWRSQLAIVHQKEKDL